MVKQIKKLRKAKAVTVLGGKLSNTTKPINPSGGKNTVNIDTDHVSDHDKKILQVRALLDAREQARKNSNFITSDKLRDELTKLGVYVQDQGGDSGPSGWRFLDGSSKQLSSKISNVSTKPIQSTEKLKDILKSKDVTAKTIKTDKMKSPSSSSSAEQDRIKAALSKVTGISDGRFNIQGVTIKDLKVGTGKEAVRGSRVKVHYEGRLKSNNLIFDASKKPFVFSIGRGEVIRGWDIGVCGMKVGGKRELDIPPEKAYGRSGAPPTIPPNATLLFDVTLLEVK